MLRLILGGARSGKSKFAQRITAPAQRVTYIATAEANDDPEMVARIAQHRQDRPDFWRTMEEPLALACAVEHAAAEAEVVVVDCLSIWLSNLFWRFREETQRQVADRVRAELSRIASASHKCEIILVSNETGCGIVPEHALARAFRDAQGFLNQWAAEAAEEVIFMVAGLPMYLKPAASGNY